MLRNHTSIAWEVQPFRMRRKSILCLRFLWCWRELQTVKMAIMTTRNTTSNHMYKSASQNGFLHEETAKRNLTMVSNPHLPYFFTHLLPIWFVPSINIVQGMPANNKQIHNSSWNRATIPSERQMSRHQRGCLLESQGISGWCKKNCFLTAAWARVYEGDGSASASALREYDVHNRQACMKDSKGKFPVLPLSVE